MFSLRNSIDCIYFIVFAYRNTHAELLSIERKDMHNVWVCIYVTYSIMWVLDKFWITVTVDCQFNYIFPEMISSQPPSFQICFQPLGREKKKSLKVLSLKGNVSWMFKVFFFFFKILFI